MLGLMAPKRTAKIVGSVQRKTRKVVEKTVQVSAVVGAPGDSQEDVEIPAAKESKVVEIEVEEEESQIPINIVTSLPDSQSDQQPETSATAAAEAAEGNERGEEHHKQKEANEAVQDFSKQRKEAGKAEENIADKETQKEQGGRREEESLKTPKKVEIVSKQTLGENKEMKDEADKRKGEADGGKGRKRPRRKTKRYAGSGGGVGEMDGVGRGYKRYVFRVLKLVHPDLGVSARAMAVLDGMMGDMFERLADEAARLSKYTKKATLTSREIQSAVKLVLPGELGKHAISEGAKAVSNYMSADD